MLTPGVSPLWARRADRSAAPAQRVRASPFLHMARCAHLINIPSGPAPPNRSTVEPSVAWALCLGVIGMASSKIVEALQQVAIFRGLEAPQLTALARHTERIKFAPGEFITRAGEAG